MNKLRKRKGGIFPALRHACMGRCAHHADGHAPRSAVDCPISDAYRAEWISRPIMKRKYLIDLFFRDERRALDGAIARFLRRLKDKIYIVRAAVFIDFHRKRCKGSAMAIMATFMAHARYLGSIWHIAYILDGERIMIRTERDAPLCLRCTVHRIKPTSPVDYRKIRMRAQKAHEFRARPFLMVGKFRMRMQCMA